jgi:hypothetical protein
MKSNKFLIMIVAGMILFACQEEEGRLDHIDDSEPAPAQVTIVGEPVALPGGAVIQIAVPNDKNLLSVKAVYERNGETIHTEVSRYKDSLTVEGYGQAGTHEVLIYSVGRNEKLSEPVKTTVSVLTPPVMTVEKNLAGSFGGVNINFSSNDSRAPLAYVVLADTTNTGKWSNVQTFYSSADKGSFKIRGLDAVETKFAFYARDRWNNVSDTLIETIMPLFEEKLSTDTWTNAKLPTDSWTPRDNADYWMLENLWTGYEQARMTPWDGYTYETWESLWNCVQTSVLPHWITISLGYKASISRLHVWPFGIWTSDYSGENWREIELWGSDNPPANGSWDNWYFLGHFEVFKPSGYGAGGDIGTVTDEDRDWFRNKQDYEVVATDQNPDPYKPVTHIRIKVIETFLHKQGNPSCMAGAAEIRLYGAKEN